MDNGKPETVAPAGFRSKERIEHSGPLLKSHAAAGVGDLQFDVIALNKTVRDRHSKVYGDTPGGYEDNSVSISYRL